MTKPVLSDFESGVMVALGALKIAAMKTPGFNVEALEQASQILRRSMQGIKDQAAFELPISCVEARHEDVAKLIAKKSH